MVLSLLRDPRRAQTISATRLRVVEDILFCIFFAIPQSNRSTLILPSLLVGIGTLAAIVLPWLRGAREVVVPTAVDVVEVEAIERVKRDDEIFFGDEFF
jgi:hypothetical protein